MNITITHKNPDGSQTTITIDPATLGGAGVNGFATASQGDTTGTPEEKAFAGLFAWPPEEPIRFAKSDPDFEKKRKAIKGLGRHRWNPDFDDGSGANKGAWVFKTS